MIEAQDEEVTQVAHWNLQAYAEIHVRQRAIVSAVGCGMVVKIRPAANRLAVVSVSESIAPSSRMAFGIFKSITSQLQLIGYLHALALSCLYSELWA